jgi:transposase
MSIKLLAIDLAKDVFQVHGLDERGVVRLKKKLKREELITFTAQLPPCRIAMEACGGSHYWARKFRAQGHDPKIIAAQFVKPFKLTTQKNDENDAAAIAEAASRPSMRFVGIKDVNQQDIQSLHRIRGLLVKTRTSFVNQCRGLAHEYGVVISRGITRFRKEIQEVLEEDNELTPTLREALFSLREAVIKMDMEIASTEKKIKALAQSNKDFERLLEVPGVGPLTASLFLSSVGDVSVFKNGRHVAAWLGAVPRQHSSGGATKLLGITKSGNSDLRVMMVHGARALITATLRKRGQDPYSQWILNLLDKKGWNVTAIAIVNRNCRVMHHLMKHDERYKRNVA